MPIMFDGQVSHFYSVDYATEPEAEWVVFIHGAGLDSTSWETLLPYMRGSYHILLYDLRGHGESGGGESPFHWKQFIGDLNLLLEKVGATRVHIVAHGVGSLIAAQMSMLYPHKVNTLTLMSIPIILTAEIADKIIEHRRRLIAHEGMEAVADYLLKQITLQPMDSPVVRRLRRSLLKISGKRYVEIFEVYNRIQVELYDSFRLCTRPVLVLTGVSDPLYPPYLSDMVAKRLPGSQYSTVPASSNMVFVDQPAYTAEQISVFINSWKPCKPSGCERAIDPFLLATQDELQMMIDRHYGAKRLLPLRIELLHTFRVYIGTREVEEGWARRWAKEIVVFLLFHRRTTRTELCEALWGEVDVAKSRSRLRVYLTHLRRLLEVDGQSPYLTQTREFIYLSGDIECDLFTLIQRIHSARQEQDETTKAQLITEIIANIPRNLLAGFCENWILELREELEGQLAELAEWMCGRCERLGDYAEAAQYVKLQLQFDPEEPSLYEKVERLMRKANKPKEAAEYRRKKLKITDETEQSRLRPSL